MLNLFCLIEISLIILIDYFKLIILFFVLLVGLGILNIGIGYVGI